MLGMRERRVWLVKLAWSHLLLRHYRSRQNCHGYAVIALFMS